MTQETTEKGAARINLQAPALVEVMRAMYGLEAPLRHSSLEPALRELVKVRASQLNGCAYCLDMHTKDARAQGESEQRLYAVAAWRETPFFTERERAALEWTEHLTLMANKGVSNKLFDEVRRHFSEEELVHLTLAAVQINGWNRLAVAAGMPAGSYRPGQFNQ